MENTRKYNDAVKLAKYSPDKYMKWLLGSWPVEAEAKKAADIIRKALMPKHMH